MNMMIQIEIERNSTLSHHDRVYIILQNTNKKLQLARIGEAGHNIRTRNQETTERRESSSKMEEINICESKPRKEPAPTSRYHPNWLSINIHPTWNWSCRSPIQHQRSNINFTFPPRIFTLPSSFLSTQQNFSFVTSSRLRSTTIACPWNFGTKAGPSPPTGIIRGSWH